MSNDEFRFSEDLDSIGAEFDKQLNNRDSEKTAQALKKARLLCIREEFDEALKIYKGIVDEDMECIAGYIGILRVHSKDFTVFDGAEIEKDIKIISKIGDGSEADDDEYVDYLKKRKEFLAKNPTAPTAPATTEKPVLPDGILSKEETKKLYDAKDYKKAIPSLLYYGKAESDAIIWQDLTLCYLYGQGVEQDYMAAEYWGEKYALTGSKFGQNLLGVVYYDQNKYEEATEWFKKAVEQDFAPSKYRLGWCYEHGEGVRKNMDRALALYRQAADAGVEGAKDRLKYLKK